MSANPEYFYDERRGRYWHRTGRSEWVDKSETQLRRWLKQQGIRDFADRKAGEVVSPLEVELIDAETDRRVFYAGPLAGYREGVHEMDAARILVTRSPRLLDPRPGEWPTLAAWFKALLCAPDDEVDQRPYFHGWMRQTLESLYAGWWSRGLFLALAGEAGSGKSLMTEIVRIGTGGRVAKPYRYMIGQDNFNEEMFESVLQLIDDENADTSIRARRQFAAQIKQIVANSEARCRGMHQKAMTLKPVWRLLAAVNLEPDNLMVLPPVDDDIADKMMLLRVYSGFEYPRREAEKRALFERMVSELPSYVHWLLHEWEIPEYLSGRFGITHFHHPDVLEVLDETSPFERLGRLIDAAILVRAPEWRGTAADLERVLKAEDNGLLRADRDWIPQPVWLGRHLHRLSAKYGEHRYSLSVKNRLGKQWTILRERSVAE
ncbi:MAG: hypothetical protein JJT96_10060 [Opitutales bacterium]|nr:hypothetical protein [Opitutales bacterium]